MENTKKAILVVSFGTSHADTRIRSIESIEKKVEESFPGMKVYRAWTSDTIRRIVKKRDALSIDSIPEALQRIREEGYTEVVIQPTHVINGYENDKMCELIKEHEKNFDKVTIGNALLTSQEDMEQIVNLIGRKWKDVPKEDAVVLMGHGTEHYANCVYAALDYMLKEKGYSNIHMGTVESYPSIDTVKDVLKREQPKKVTLSPFMIVAGDHAKNDMAGEEEDSWKSQIEAMGFPVECRMYSLGEMNEVQELFVTHVRNAK